MAAGLGQRKFRMNLEYHAALEMKGLLKKLWEFVKRTQESAAKRTNTSR